MHSKVNHSCSSYYMIYSEYANNQVQQSRNIKAVKCFIFCKGYDQVQLTTRILISHFEFEFEQTIANLGSKNVQCGQYFIPRMAFEKYIPM